MTSGVACVLHVKAMLARFRLERQYNACDNHTKQCRPNETKPNSNAIQPRERHNNPNNPTNIHTPNRITSTHTPLTYTGMQPHAPGQPAGDHPVPAHTECQNPSRCGRNGKLEALLPSKWKAKCLGQQWREGEIARVSHHRSKSTPAHHLVRQILVSHGKCKGGPSGHGRLLKLQDATADATLMTVQR